MPRKYVRVNRKQTAGRRQASMTDMTTFQKAVRERLPGLRTPDEARKQLRAAAKRASTQRLDAILREFDRTKRR